MKCPHEGCQNSIESHQSCCGCCQPAFVDKKELAALKADAARWRYVKENVQKVSERIGYWGTAQEAQDFVDSQIG